MPKLMAVLFLLVVSPLLLADEVILKDGKSVEFRVLKDNGETIEVQTVDAKTITIAKKDVKDVKLYVPKAPLTGATFTGDLTKGGGVTNLLPLIKPKEHATSGEWRFAGGALSGKNGLLDVPHIPPASYDVEIVVERREGESDLCIGLVGGGKPFAIMFDCGKGSWSGISAIDGKRSYENESRTNGKMLHPRKAVRIVCAVRADGVVVLVDGKEFIRWSGEPKRLSHPDRPDKYQNLFLYALESSFVISHFTITARN